MALVTAIAGRYSSTYTVPSGSPTDLGIMEDPGYRLRFVPAWELINDTDAYAQNAIEAITLGLSLVALDFVCKEAAKTMAYRITNPLATFTPTGATTFRPGAPGRLGSALAGALILTSTPGTPAVATPATLTATLAMIREGFDVELIFGPRHRKVPVGVRLLAYDGGSGAAEYFSAT